MPTPLTMTDYIMFRAFTDESSATPQHLPSPAPLSALTRDDKQRFDGEVSCPEVRRSRERWCSSFVNEYIQTSTIYSINVHTRSNDSHHGIETLYIHILSLSHTHTHTFIYTITSYSNRHTSLSLTNKRESRARHSQKRPPSRHTLS